MDRLRQTRTQVFDALANSKRDEAVAADLANRIGLTVASTLSKLPLADNRDPSRPLKVSPDIDASHHVFEKVFSIFLAYPMYLANVYRTYVSPEAKPKVAEPALADDINFVRVCEAVFGCVAAARPGGEWGVGSGRRPGGESAPLLASLRVPPCPDTFALPC